MSTSVAATERDDTQSGDPVVEEAFLNDLMARIEAEGTELLGPDGVLTQLTSRLLNRALEAEMSDHLGYEKGDPRGRGSGNNRNGRYPKRLITDAGAVPVEVPRDRNGTFEPKLIPKGQRRLDGFNELVCSLVARGMTVRDVRAHLAEVYSVEVSPELISKITDAVLPELRAWQNRPLDAVYPILYLDAIWVKIRTDAGVVNRACQIAMGVDVDGRKQVLGMWIQHNETSKFWLGVLTELRNRGLADVLVVCCDGLTGFPEAIAVTWPKAKIQTCVVHLIRNSLRYVSYKDRRAVVAALKTIYRAPTVEAAADALDTFELEWGDRYPAIVEQWRRHWDEFIPFFEFPPEIRKIIYTTNAIESLNYQLRKMIKTRGHFPTEDAALKMFYMAIVNIGTTRGGELGTGSQGWKAALNAFAIHFDGRLNIR